MRRSNQSHKYVHAPAGILNVSAGTKFGCSLPFIVDGEICVKASASVSLTLGETKTINETVSGSYPVVPGPNTQVKCEIVANETKLKSALYYASSKSRKQSGGMWGGVTTWNVETSYKEEKLHPDDTK